MSENTLAWEVVLENGKVRIGFEDLESNWSGWVRWNPQQAREVAAKLVSAADEIERQGGFQEQHAITLNGYHIANLRALIQAIGYPYQSIASPIRGLDTGDWVGEIWWKLPKVDHPPNREPQEMADAVRWNVEMELEQEQDPGEHPGVEGMSEPPGG